MLRKNIATFIFVLYFCNVFGEMFVSTAWLSASKMAAVNLVKFIDKFVKKGEVTKDIAHKNENQNNSEQEERITEELKRISSKLKTHLSAEMNGTKPVPANPISMYLYAKTISEATTSIREMLNQTTSHTHLKAIDLLFLPGLPQREDVIGVIKSFIRLQSTYNLTTAEMAFGDVLGIKVEPLAALDCYDIGRFIYNSGHSMIALQWFQTALLKNVNGDILKTNRTQLLNDLYNIIQTEKHKDNEERDHKKENLPKRTERGKAELEQSLQNEFLNYYDADISRNLKAEKVYESLCAKADTRMKGYCKYSNIKDLPFFKRPFKIEYIHDSPRILVVHDVIDNNLIDYLTGNYLLLHRSTVLNATKDGVVISGSESRISSTYSLMDDMEEPLVLKFYDHLERLTGLRMNAVQGEHLQVVNYGIGGEFKPHFDWLEKKVLDSGASQTGTNRLLTIIAYLSDVDIGGSTVFPQVGISVAPVKGSALIFTNLDDKWRGDPLSLHAGCPVFFGSKWIATKWAHTKGQDKNFLQTVPSIWT